ncbi:MAG TPA: hypothetical protein DDZ96_14995 [Porphyromonadaceae bacterium]|jgi:uncharacterized lipoprotein YehR (DUF1307 family)|nr:hypothetical protein [Porphyromonadaceae bacterium]HBX19285.1 hypothetical protein [Porphyromonadaceae bacterium]HCM20441.1 hypothetical protein [Porphyromonadaceae bacterium]
MKKMKYIINAGIAIALFLIVSTGCNAQSKENQAKATPVNTSTNTVNKQDEIVARLKEGKSVFVVISKKSLTDKAKVLSVCKDAQQSLSGKVETIEVDADSKTDENLLKTLKVVEPLKEIITVVINKQGFVTGQFTGVPKQSELVAASNKIVQTGCCPR